MSEEYVVLRTFDSEGEARVVESFLRAKGFDVLLLGAHAHQTTAVRGFDAGVGMRLIVREPAAEAATQAMREAESAGSAELNTGAQPPRFAQRDYVIFVLIFVLAAIVYVALHIK